MAGWNVDTAAGPLGAGTVTLVEGSSFCISLPNGDIEPEHPHGVFFQDTRILSGWVLTVNGQCIGTTGCRNEGALSGAVCWEGASFGRLRGQPAHRGAATRSGRWYQGAGQSSKLLEGACRMCDLAEGRSGLRRSFRSQGGTHSATLGPNAPCRRRLADYPGFLAGDPEGHPCPGPWRRRHVGRPHVQHDGCSA